jgi:Fe2+ or Zn2+ uptake regulation protein
MSAEEDVSTFLRTLTKPPQFKVLTALAEKPAQEFTKTEIANRSGIGRTTLYRIWEDLEKMKAITASRQVGAVTLYRLNPESPVVQSLLSIRDKLATIQIAVERIETLQHTKKSEKPQDQIPPAQSTLLKLLDIKATSSERAITEEALRLKEHERVILPSLVESGLIERNGKIYSLSPFGKITAESAARLWGHETRESIDETISSLKVALGIVSQEIKKASRDLSADKSTHQSE